MDCFFPKNKLMMKTEFLKTNGPRCMCVSCSWQLKSRWVISPESIVKSDNVKWHYETKQKHFKQKLEKSSSAILNKAPVVILIIWSLISFISQQVILGALFRADIYVFLKWSHYKWTVVMAGQFGLSQNGSPVTTCDWSSVVLIGLFCTLTRASLRNVLHFTDFFR